MRPVLFQFGPFALYSYGTMLAIGVVAAALSVRRSLAAIGINGDRLLNLLLLSMIMSLVGASLAFGALNRTSAVPLFHGGLSFFGGLAFGAISLVLLAIRWGIPVIDIFDAVVPGLALGEAITRIGCDIFGKPTSDWWGVSHDGLSVHPVQLYSFALNLIIYAALKRSRPQHAGCTSGLYLALLGVSRFILEFFRSGSNSWPTWGQGAAVIAVLLGGAFLLLFRGRPVAIAPSRLTWMDFAPLALVPAFFVFAG